MRCPYEGQCGGCAYIDITEESYQKQKQTLFAKQLSKLHIPAKKIDSPVFITDGKRRRAALTFIISKGHVTLGFNAHHSKEIIDIENCALLTQKLNQSIPLLKNLLQELYATEFHQRTGKKITTLRLQQGDIWLAELDNGIDVVLEFDLELEISHQMAISDFAAKAQDIIRISHRRKNQDTPELILEKSRPYSKIGNVNVYVPAGTFMQASKDSETFLIDIVKKYMGNTSGKIADLFCGMGTFSYPLSENKKNKIMAVDSSSELLSAFADNIKKNQISNIEIRKQNLFKYPLIGKDIEGFDAIVFDPPRAGASAQIKGIAALPDDKKPQKIIAVSCNPETFVNDANKLQESGYVLQNITMVDQFVYSNHLELVALFERENQ